MAKAKGKRKSTRSKDAQWAEAKRRCRLNAEDVRMAKELGVTPRALIKNIPSQPWKAPVKEWVRDLYAKKQAKAAKRAKRKAKAAREKREEPTAVDHVDDDERRIAARIAMEAALGEEAIDLLGEDVLLPYFEDEVDPLPLADDDAPLGEDPLPDDSEVPGGQAPGPSVARLTRHAEYRRAAEYVAHAFAGLPAVERVVLFGSVALAGQRRRPKDVDLAVWVSDLACLRDMQRANSRAVVHLFADHEIGVAHHQVDIFLMEPGTNRYLGRLCHYSTCPKHDKFDCLAPGCGTTPHLQQHKRFALSPDSLLPDRTVVLFQREPDAAPEHGDEIPF